MRTRQAFIVAALSTTLIALELTWTRIFSAEFYYTFAFLVLSLAVLGIGLGALALHLFPRLNRDRYLGVYLSATGLMTLAGPPLVFKIGLDFTQMFHSWQMAGIFLLATVILSAAFFFGGMALALIFKQHHRDIPRLYMADLLGAGAGILLVFPLMQWLGTPTATFYCAVPVLMAALAAPGRLGKVAPLFLGVAMVWLGMGAEPLLKAPREDRAPVIYTHWDAMGKIKIYDFGEGYRGIEIDNMANSPIYEFDGNWDRPDSMKFEFLLDISYLFTQCPDAVFLALGAGGGTDILQALQCNAREAHAVEVIPHINDMMTTGYLADYTGRIYDDPRVIVVTEDARAYARRFEKKFDLVYSKSSNTFSAVASGAFSMVENYLFTTEAFEDYWRAMTDRGFLVMEHQFYMPRLTTEVMIALRRAGVAEPTEHFAIYNLPQMRRKVLLLSKRPLTDEIRTHAFGELTPEVDPYIHLLLPPGEGHADNHYERIVTQGWRAVADSLPIDLSPTTDNRPYIAQMGLLKNFSFERLESMVPYIEVFGFPLAKLMILIILGIMLLAIVPLNLLPFLKRGAKLRAAPWLFFFAIGMAYMAVEVVLIQKYALFIGISVYSMATVLMTLLIASGLGSRIAPRIDARLTFGAIIGWLLLEIFLFPHLTQTLAHLTQPGRIAIAALLIAPLGFFMGMPFPKAGLRVGTLIDWGLAVNGAASVLGSTAIVLLAFTHGFSAALLAGAGLYMLAFLLYSAEAHW